MNLLDVLGSMIACTLRFSPDMFKQLKLENNKTKIIWKKLTAIILLTFVGCFMITQYLRPIYYSSDRFTIKAEPNRGERGRTLYIITATYPRALQLAELTRLSQTLMHVPDLVWLVVDDTKRKSVAVEALLRRSGLDYVYMTAPMPDEMREACQDYGWLPRGVSNRNRGLEWLRANASSGVFFFADDDNTYDLRIFKEMRNTRKVSMWPVGNLYMGFESPVVRDGKVVGFCSGYSDDREWKSDMAGFAVSVEFLLERPNAIMPYPVGIQESGFLSSLSPLSPIDVEPKANNCKEILVWHTQTKDPPGEQRPLESEELYADTNILELYESLTL